MKKILLFVLFLLISFAVDARAADLTITMSNQRFSDNDIKIRAGDSVLFTNADKISYNVQIMDNKGNVNDIGLQKPGETTKSNFNDAGEYKVTCGIHPNMLLKIKVQ